jgi:hypothetical protein
LTSVVDVLPTIKCYPSLLLLLWEGVRVSEETADSRQPTVDIGEQKTNNPCVPRRGCIRKTSGFLGFHIM